MHELETRGGVAILRLRHGKANAIDSGLAASLHERLRELEASEEHRALVLTGGGAMFSAGVDLFRVLEGGEEYVEGFLPVFGRMLEALFHFPKPAVAAVNGHAVAGGCVLVCACDHRVMAEGEGTIGVPELHVGLPFPAVALEVLRFATPAHRLPDLLYGGRTFPPQEALARGLVDEVVPPDSLLDRACDVAGRFARVPPRVFALTKRQVRREVERRLGPPPWEIEPEVRTRWTDPRSHEVIRAYLERTLGKSRRGGEKG